MAEIGTMRSYTTVDKSGWGGGPWDVEPDKAQWIDEATNLDCLIVRGPGGALCGYVGVPPEHPWHGKDYGAKVLDGGDEWSGRIDGMVEVHGGLTYADACQEREDESVGVCHVPLPGRSPEMWWFGFDCAHLYDETPAFAAMDRKRGESTIREPGASYRDFSYVQAECAKLAQQLAGVR